MRAWILSDGSLEEADNQHSISRWSSMVKRTFDILVAAFGLTLLSPLIGLVALLIKRDSPGPVLYRGPRCGKNGRLFHILKFRTMYETLDCHAGPRITAQDDPRITSLGRFLRNSKLNELPQLWNVLVGEMSLVGPRPEDPQVACSWSDEARQEVLSVRPGITSPASVMFRNEEGLLQVGDVMDTYLSSIQPSKLRLDQLYVRHRSFLLDLDTLFWTGLVLLPRLGEYAPPEDRLFVGPLSRLLERYVRWFLLDSAVTATAIGITGIVWRRFGPLNVGWPMAIWVGLGFSLLFSLTGALMGVNRIVWSRASLTDAFDLLPAFLVGTAAAITIDISLRQPPLLPLSLVIISAALALLGFVVVRYYRRLLHGLEVRITRGSLGMQERVLMVGGGEAGQFMAWFLQNGRSRRGFRIVGCVDDDLYKQGSRIYGMNVLGRRDDIPTLVHQHDIGIIIFAIHNISVGDRRQVLDICGRTKAQVVMMPDFLADLRGAANGNGHPKDSNGEAGDTVNDRQVHAWLDDLEQAASAGDVDGVMGKIRRIRSEMGEETA